MASNWLLTGILLADGEFNFATTLETKALKKQANNEVFQSILENFRISLADLDFIDENKEFFSEESDLDLQLSIEKLRTKYDNNK